MVSLTKMKQVPADVLSERMEEIKVLSADEEAHEHYRIVKDRETGEHYLHYAYIHLNLAGGGVEEWFHQLLPLETDDVLALVLGEQAFHFPDHWRKPFLRNGPAGFYVWFDPSGTEELARYEKLGAEIASILTEFKRQGRFDEQAIRDVVERLNRLDPGNV